ncbi:similar to Saccharomyces cerevisiae YBR182C SMP1 Putative transcription factor involved in regulating the response to osmotic stress [Maudiozyma saulgeensis]|uniref:Similar to Saccharomyces cerevisiae YBR182C SMP1 Putative transcription factor involved in regulating the response to osmotic stress n=1 Tax=Maudiozyma saulgeensis TaxID=1789683 RepID=A0A1X7R1M9_9SACH|nr:similar to Saccharomyces cerevisiae YBR182C SMP1 Putative transcription factor involved in regulating the response to osmotic stress [Kazachstania saulgeensis]
MGRRKIDIQPITEDRNRTVTFIKRKAGLFKKAHELSVLCQAEVSLIILGANNTFYEYSSVAVDDLMKYYNDDKSLRHVIKHPSDFGDFKQREFVTLNKNIRRRNYAKKNVTTVTTTEKQNTDDKDAIKNKEVENIDSDNQRPAKRPRLDENEHTIAPVSPHSTISLPETRTLSADHTHIPPTLPHIDGIHNFHASHTDSVPLKHENTSNTNTNIPQPQRRSITPPLIEKSVASSNRSTPPSSVVDTLPTLKFNQMVPQQPMYSNGLTSTVPPTGYAPSPVQHLPMTSPMPHQVSVGFPQRVLPYTTNQRYLQPVPAGTLQRHNLSDSNITSTLPMTASHEWYQAGTAPLSGVAAAVPIYVTASGPMYQTEYPRLQAYPQSIAVGPPHIETNMAVPEKRYLPPTPTSFDRIVLPSVRRPSSASSTTIHTTGNADISHHQFHQSPKSQISVNTETEKV